MRSITFLILLTLCSIQCAFSQFNRLFTSDSDLPNSLINDVVEGPDEMIWVATEDGLCRFDGSRFTTYRNDPKNPHSLASNFVRTLCADDKGHLLVGTLSGVQMYRPEHDDFTFLFLNPTIRVNEGNISDIILLHNGDFFATGNNTFTIHINEQNEAEVKENQLTNKVTLTYRAAEDHEGNIWVIKQNEDLYLLDKEGTLTPFRPNGQRLDFASLGCDSEGNLYAGGAGSGVYKYNDQEKTFDLISLPTQRFSVRDLCPVPGTHQMYLGTDGEGAKVLDCQTGQITSLVFDDDRIDAATQKVHSIAISKNGELWMALYQKGVFEMARNPLQFRYFGSKSVRYNCIGDRCVTSVLRLHDGNIWVATDNGGLYSINQQGQTLSHFPVTQQPGSVPLAFMNIFEDSRHRLWFGSFQQGGGIVDTKTGHCQYIDIAGQDGLSANIYAFAEDKRGNIWVATMGLGILRYNESAKEFRQVLTDNSNLWSCDLDYDPEEDKLYVGSYNGLSTITIKDDSISCEQSFPEYIIFSITRFSGNKLALCTNQGLIVYDSETHIHRRYTTEDGLPNNNTYAALCDNEGNLWISSNAGLSKLNMNQAQFTNYSVRDGLQGNEYYKNAAMRDSDGTLWFGGTHGLTWFKPLSIYSQVQSHRVRIVDCRSDQMTILPDADGVYQLTDDNHSFSIELATCPIMLTGRVVYRYSMDGDRWQLLPPGLNRVSFSHISSGTHQFRFQSIFDGTTSDIETAEIRIAYPWYKSWWAMLIWLGILALIVYLVIQLVRRRMQMRRRLREHHQHEAINEAKLQFFMNISHEFRTPMTLILSPLQKLMTTDSDPQRQRSYKLIERNANRILTLINELMDLRKIDSAQMKIMCRPVEIVSHVYDLCNTVSDIAEIRKIQLSVTNHLTNETTLMLDTTVFEKILINLLSNALKFTPEGGAIDVLLTHGDTNKKFPDGSVEIHVSDTGIGIPASEREHIFDRFYQVRNDISHSMGTGIGLNLVHSLVTLHHGTIEVADNPNGKGTCFIVSLPVGTKVFGKEEINTIKSETPGLYQTSIITSPILQSLPESSTEKEEAQENAAAPASRKKIAVVEDDEEIRKFIIAELSPFYHVTGFPDGQPAFEAIMTESFDLVLSDVMMLSMDGETLCRKIRSNVRLNHIPVVLLTAKTSDEDRLKSLEIGANAFLTKPFNVELLKKTIQNLLESQDRLRNSFSGQQVPADQIATPEMKSPDERLLERVVKVINDNLNNPELTSDMIAKEVGLSRVHLYRKLKELTNQSARNYFRNIRLTKAAELLSQKKMAVAEVAYQVGFANPNNFATAFKELYGVSPSQYMEGHRPQPQVQSQTQVLDQAQSPRGADEEPAAPEESGQEENEASV